MSYQRSIVNQFITINDRLYNCFTLIRWVDDVVLDDWVEHDVGMDLKNWILEYVYGGAMPGFRRFMVGGYPSLFLDALERISERWWHIENGRDTESMSDNDSMGTLSSNSVHEIFATAHFVRDLLTDDVGSWTETDIDGLPEAEVVELVEF